MNETNMDWDDLRLFLAIARSGGLAPAAASTGKSPPTLGRRMVALERRLGCELFRRLPRGYELTAQGEELRQTVKALESRIDPLLQRASTARAAIKISAGTWVTYYLCQHLPQIMGGDPITLRFIAADEVLDISRREAVIGVRNQRPTGASLAGRKIGSVHFAVYAGANPQAPMAQVMGDTPSARWVRATFGAHAGIEVTSPRTALDLALTGQARAVLPTFIGDILPELTRTSPQIKELDHDQWLVTHHEDRSLPEVRKVIDRVYAVLRQAGA